MIRNRHRIGDHLLVDDESGFVIYRSQAVQRWDGLWVRKDQNETRNPQEFVRAKNDPRALRDVRPEAPVGAVCLYTPPVVGQTNIPTPASPRTNFAGIGNMTISSGQSDTDTCGPFCVYNTSQI